MKKYILGIDNGGTISKVALFDLTGNQIIAKSKRIPMSTPKEGFTQRKLNDIWKVNADIISQVVQECDGDIVSIGVTGHGKGLYVLGKNNEYIYDGIGSTDSRAINYEIRWNKDGTSERIYNKTAQKILACQPVSILRWLKDHERQVYDKIEYIMAIKDFIRYCLTGNINCEYTDISGTNLLNLHTLKYDMDILKEFGIEEMYEKLPPIIMSSEICGYVSRECANITKLREGTPVVGGMFDIDACAVAMGTIHPMDMCIIAGTWSINEYISTKILDDKSVSMISVYCDPKYYLAEESSAASAGNFEWFKDIFKDKSYEEYDKLVEGIEPQDCKVYYLPFLYASNENPLAKGTLVGLSGHHNIAHIARAVFEGVVFSHKTHIKALINSGNQPPIIRLAGGVVNSNVWTQMFADVLGIPMQLIADTELGAKGAAMAAGIGIGVYKDYEDAAQKCVKKGRIVYPNKAYTTIYEKKYKTYKAIATALDGIWKQL